MRSDLKKRLADIEGRAKNTNSGPVVWVSPGQSREDAKAARGLGPDDPCTFFVWQPTQEPKEPANA